MLVGLDAMNSGEIENLASQKDELEALASIYGSDFAIEDHFCPTISITIRFSDNERDEVTLVVSFNSDYPSNAPPLFHLSVPWIKRDKKQALDKDLQDVYSQHLGENIVYIWVERLRELLLVEFKSSPAELPDPEKVPVPPVSPKTKSALLLPVILTGEPLTDRKSTFQAHVAAITHVGQVGLVIEELMKNKKIASATHNMYAYRVFRQESKSWQQDCDDDGETHAGGRLLHLLQILNCSNVLVVVSRWYGGILLYGDRFKHISNVSRQLLEKEGFIQSTNSNLNNKKSVEISV